MEYFSVKNYAEFQHYKDRTPPWIKLYNSILEDYDFSCLPDSSKLHLIMIWLLASRMKNKMPLDSAWIKDKLHLDKKPDLKLLLDKGFILSDSNLLQENKNCASTEREEREKRGRAEERENTMLVFNCWRDVLGHKRANLDAKRKKEIRTALSLGYSSDELQQAIIGCSKSDFHMGVNDRGQKYDSINLIFRDADQIDKFIMIATNGGAKAGRQSMVGKLSSSAIDGFVDEQSVIEVVAHG